MLTVIYDPLHGIVVPDSNLRNYAETIVNESKGIDLEVTVGSEVLIEYIRLSIIKENMFDQFILKFMNGESTTLNPIQFLFDDNTNIGSHSYDVVYEIMKLRIKASEDRKHEKENND